MLADAVQLGQRDGRVGADDPEELDRAQSRHGGRSPSRGRAGASAGASSGSTFQRPRPAPRRGRGFCQLRKNGNSPSQPVSRVFWAVGWPFICMTPQPGLPIMPADEVEVVHLAGRRRRLVRLVDPLEHACETSVCAVPISSAAARSCRAGDAGDLLDPLRRVLRDRLARGARSPTVCLSMNVAVDVPACDEQVEQAVHAAATFVPTRGREVDVGLRAPSAVRRGSMTISFGGFGPARRSRTRIHEHRLGLGDVVADEEQAVGDVEVGVASTAGRRSRTSPAGPATAVAVQSRVLPSTWLVPRPAWAMTREGVILLEEQLAGVVERRRRSAVYFSRSSRGSGGRPGPSPRPSVASRKLAAVADERARSAGRGCGWPASRAAPWARAGRG